MMTLLLNTAGNPVSFNLANYNLQFTQGNIQWLAQKLKIRLSMVLGEWYLDSTIGLPYFSIIFQKGANQAMINALFTAAILGCPGVASLEQMSLSVVPYPNGSGSFPRGQIQGSFTVQAESGEIVEVSYE
jgi:hypothetical protein